MDRTERLAVNLYDLDRVAPSLRASLVAPRLDLTKPIDMGWDRKSDDETAVVFNCDLLSAAIICDTLRSHDRAAGDSPTRVYLFKKVWTRVASHVVLTELVDGRCQLSPDVFVVEVEAAPVVAPAISRRVL